MYYEWAGERDLNPNKTLSDDEIEDLYGHYEEGLTPNYVASVEEAVEARDIKGGLIPGRGDYPESKEPICDSFSFIAVSISGVVYFPSSTELVPVIFTEYDTPSRSTGLVNIYLLLPS